MLRTAVFIAALTACVAATKCYPPLQAVQCPGIACNRTSGACMPCQASSECYFLSMGCVHQRCVTNPLFSMPVVRLVFNFLVGVVICAVGVIAGVGGGGSLTPLYALMMGMPMPAAVLASLVTIFGQGVINVPMVAVQYHAYRPRAALNYKLLAHWYPITAAGAVVGTLIGRMLHNWFRNIILIVVVGFGCYRVAKKTLSGEERAHTPVPTGVKSVGTLSSTGSVKRFRWLEILSLLTTVAIAVGAHVGPVMAGCGTFGYWLYVSVGLVALMLQVVGWALHQLITVQRVRLHIVDVEEVHYGFQTMHMVVLPALTFLAGFCASTVGIGGGMVVNPILVEAGLTQEEISASGGLVTFMIALQSTIGVLILQNASLPILWVVYFFLIGATSTAIARLWALPELKRRGAKKAILVSLVLSLASTIALVCVYFIIDIINMVHYDVPFNFGRLCPPTHT